jgi:hypothetical protein
MQADDIAICAYINVFFFYKINIIMDPLIDITNYWDKVPDSLYYNWHNSNTNVLARFNIAGLNHNFIKFVTGNTNCLIFPSIIKWFGNWVCLKMLKNMTL